MGQWSHYGRNCGKSFDQKLSPWFQGNSIRWFISLIVRLSLVRGPNQALTFFRESRVTLLLNRVWNIAHLLSFVLPSFRLPLLVETKIITNYEKLIQPFSERASEDGSRVLCFNLETSTTRITNLLGQLYFQLSSLLRSFTGTGFLPGFFQQSEKEGN